jgi:hypothetical protein
MVGWTIVSAGPAQRPLPLSRAKPSAIAVAAPVDLAVSRTAKGVRLSWRDPSNGKAAFKIERKAGDQGTYQEIATTGPGKTTYDDPAEAEQAYHYRVRAFIGEGKAARFSAYSNEVRLNAARLAGLSPVITRPGVAPPAKALTIPAVIDVPGSLTVTGGQPPAAPTAVLAIPAVINPPGTLTVTGGTAKVATSVLTIPLTVNPTVTLTVTGKNPE